jgi:hypothetical protein
MNTVEPIDTYFRDKMRANRAGWELIGCRSLSAVVPDSYRDYFAALSAMTTAVWLLDKLDNDSDNDEMLQEFANRRPRQSVTLDDIDEVRDTHVDNETIGAECARLEMFLRQARADKAKGTEQMNIGNSKAMMYHFAREYAQIMYVRAAYDMLLYLIGGGVIPSVEKIGVPKGKYDGR